MTDGERPPLLYCGEALSIVFLIVNDLTLTLPFVAFAALTVPSLSSYFRYGSFLSFVFVVWDFAADGWFWDAACAPEFELWPPPPRACADIGFAKQRAPIESSASAEIAFMCPSMTEQTVIISHRSRPDRKARDAATVTSIYENNWYPSSQIAIGIATPPTSE
jgi:hypothetical protein